MQAQIDKANAEFWNELCGTQFAQSLGIKDFGPESIAKFDRGFFRLYPYFRRYIDQENLENKKVLEIGLGYGTLGQVLAQRSEYYGLDIAAHPVGMMIYRLGNIGQLSAHKRVKQGSALAIPHPDNTFDYVYSIGCLHHTGNVQKAVQEVYRVLKPGGKAVISLYHRDSLRQFMYFWKRKDRKAMAALYDINSKGETAPETVFISRKDIPVLFSGFKDIKVESQNADQLLIPGTREILMATLGKIWGLDLYIRATK